MISATLCNRIRNQLEDGSFENGVNNKVSWGNTDIWTTIWDTEKNLCYFDLKQLSEVNKRDFKLGLVFDRKIKSPSEETKKYMTRITGNKFYIPWRHFRSDTKIY